MLPQILTVNPMAKSRRRRKHHGRAHHRRQSNRLRMRHRGHHRRRRGHRRSVNNPLRLGGFSMQQDLVPALLGGAGAVGVDVGLAYLSPYLPAMLQSGWGRLLAQVGAAVGVGYLAGKATNGRVGKAVMAGGLVVTAYSGLRQALAPTLGQTVKGLSGLADFSDYRGVGAYMPQGAYMPRALPAGVGRLGAYMRAPGLGYMNPGSVLTGKRMGGFGAGYWSQPRAGMNMSAAGMI